MIKSWMPTIFGLMAAAGTFLPDFGVNEQVAKGIAAMGLILLGLTSKQFNVTGGNVLQSSSPTVTAAQTAEMKSNLTAPAVRT
jgi:hypothetical protein